MKTLLALSPHLDDAAFSVGGTLATRAAQGWRVVVATLFTGNVVQPRGFALACQLDKGLPPDVDYMALRRAEDRAACAALGARHLHLPLLEAPHRGYASAPALFAAYQPTDCVAPRLERLLRRLLRRLEPDLILAPRAIGDHVDHRRVREALKHLAPAAPTRWWEDWPYADRQPASRADAEAVALDPAARAAKRAACLAYRSQISFQFGGADALTARLATAPPVEWLHPRP